MDYRRGNKKSPAGRRGENKSRDKNTTDYAAQRDLSRMVPPQRPAIVRGFFMSGASMTAKMTTILARQAWCAALGFWPGPIDGIDGPRTRAAFVAALASYRAKGLPFEHLSGIRQVHWYWTGGGHVPNRTGLSDYRILIPAEGPTAHPAGPTTRRSHTLNANGGAVGVSICAMAGAVERPFNPGRAPITPAQVSGLVGETARLCRLYDIPVSPWPTLSHAEIQPTLGIVQRWKWDITWLPGMD